MAFKIFNQNNGGLSQTRGTNLEMQIEKKIKETAKNQSYAFGESREPHPIYKQINLF